MANPKHVKVVRQGAEAIARWREQHPKERLDLSEADLRGTSLVFANLSQANLTGADLARASLWGANTLLGADLSRANLRRVNICFADLSFANFKGANLFCANFLAVNFSGADLSTAVCNGTTFADCNLADCRGLESVVHEGPSTIGIDTLIMSFRAAGNRLTPELETFFLGAGEPKQLLDQLPEIIAEIKYCACFIAYGEPDRVFAEKLCRDLEDKEISCWLYAMDATPGERTWREITEERRKREKMVVICSAAALVREGVLKEIEEQIDEDPNKMVPVSLDNLWKAEGSRVMRGNRDLKPFLLERNYADFTKPYEQALQQLLKGLERKRS